MDLEKEFERLGLGRKPDATHAKEEHKAVQQKVLPSLTYQIIHANDPHQLTRKVNEELAKGWRPQGGVSLSCYGDSTGFVLDSYQYAQALVKNPPTSSQGPA